MNKPLSVLMSVALLTALVGCGEEIDEPHRFGDWADVPDTESHDWIVEGMRCDGEEVNRLVGVVDEKVRYRRGDDCVEVGDPFWVEPPEMDGDSLEVFLDSRAQTYVEMDIRVSNEDRFRLENSDHLFVMRRVFPEVSPTAIPGLSNFDLAGQWLMEGYPCFEDEVPQLVRIIDPPTSTFHANKIIGDECVSDGEAFLDAEISGTTVTGSPKLHDDWGFGEIQSSSEGIVEVEAFGSVRTEHFIRLNILDEVVNFRRVLGDNSD